MFVTPEEIYTHLYPEFMRAIGDTDKLMLTDALNSAQAEAKLYLHKYDTDKMFGAKSDDRDSLLLLWVKDIAVWHYVNIANPNTDLELRERRYKYAIQRLKDIQKGDSIPDFPIKEDEEGKPEYTTGMLITSNPPRTRHV